MKKRLVILVLVILLSFSALACKEPKDGKTLFETTLFCGYQYQLRNGIEIGNNDIIIDCGHAILQGIFQGKTGILIENKKNIILKNCMIMNYDIGIELVNSTNITINNVAFIRNQIGIKLYNSHNNTIIKNRDISLKREIKETESFENIFHYENKNINADFCRYNTCNFIKKIKKIPAYSKEEYSLKKILIRAIEIWINED
ncbi:hypothetical protein KY304_01305 [Candidatus Woesearchaeota archaeon]|nr:hypothetical protein [Candidatus Woesearchaeota archaeon]